MTKAEAYAIRLCEKACGLWCRRSHKPNCDMFQGDPPITRPSPDCRLTAEQIRVMKAEYNYNPVTGKLK